MSIIKVDYGEIGRDTVIDYDTTGKTATILTMSSGTAIDCPSDGVWKLTYGSVGTLHIYINDIYVSSCAFYNASDSGIIQLPVKKGDSLKYVTASAMSIRSNELYN